MKKVLFLTVVYSTPPAEASTLMSLSAHDYSKFNIEPTFAVWDNSSLGFGIETLPNLPGCTEYYHTGNNESLSLIYNHVIAENSGVEWVVILDDDSHIDTSYISALQGFWNIDVPLAVPRIEFSGALISPGCLVGVRGKALHFDEVKLEVLSVKGITAMMSGTIIRRDIFNADLLFDERLSFYGVDTRFFIDYAKFHSKIHVLNTVMNHSSALRDPRQNINASLKRLRNLMQSWPIVFDSVPLYRLRLSIYIPLFILKQVVKKRDLRFFRLFSILPFIMFR